MTSVLDRGASKPLDARVKVSAASWEPGEARGHGEERAVLQQALQRVGEELGLSQQILAHAVDEVSALLPTIKNLPTPVSSWDVKVGFNYHGDPSIYIVATVEDEHIEDIEVRCNKIIDSFSIIHKLVAEKIDRSIFIYIDLHAESEF